MNSRKSLLDSKTIYENRFDKKVNIRDKLWGVLCKNYFQKYVNPNDYVLDFAAGYCEFINNISSKHKYALDINPTTKKMANDGTEVLITNGDTIPKKYDNTFDIVFISNFFEHLNNSEELLSTLKSINRVIKVGGKIIILQPNIKLTKEAYWDFIDHKLPLTDKTMVEALKLSGFEVKILKNRFLPYTTESRLPVNPTLIKIYLKIPPLQWLLGKQSLFIATK